MKILVIFLALINTFAFPQIELEVPPELTDININKWLTPHLVVTSSTGNRTDKLFLFLPGQNRKPSDTKLILSMAARLGYYAIGLSYANTYPVNNLCANEIDTFCHESARLEIIYGIDLNDQINVNQPNSIFYRLTSLLVYLAEQYPTAGWNAFLDSDKYPVWNKISIAGFSQGGGHAALIAKFYEVARVIMFSSPGDYSDYYSQPAFWLSDSFVTPTSCMYTFAHRQDGIKRYNQIWEAMKLINLGEPVNADRVSSPYDHSHILTTNIFPGPDEDYHGSVILDISTPKDDFGDPVFKDEWLYLCFGKSSTAVLNVDNKSEKNFYLYPAYPNPFNISTKIKFRVGEERLIKLSVYNSIGQNISTLLSSDFPAGVYEITWNADNQSTGVYFVKLESPESYLINKILLVK